ncbi:2-phospho-L-lactate transferase [Euzebya sp.]|uniref:2-phospho-L-lactate transferase n=1 Tax=Euzebya sp. TaxID=1971409 RepID=UPI0035117359
MDVVALAGGIGAARFLRGLVRAVDPARLTVVANTGDDITVHGLHVSPDLDTITYTLGGGVHPAQGWGRADEAFAVATELRDRYGRPDWFTLGDRDIATHLVRTEVLSRGGRLSDATRVITDAWAIPFRLLPMTDDDVTTMIETVDGHRLHFQRWWVGERAEPPVAQVRFDGAERARPAPGVIAAIQRADVVVLCPSNPVVSIGTILAVPGIREELAAKPVVGVSPIVGGRVVRGMADKLLGVVGAETSAAGVAGLYADLLDAWVIDDADADAADGLRAGGLAVAVTDTIMSDVDVTTALARTALGLVT